MRSSQTLDSIRGGFVSFFNELDTRQGTMLKKFACPQHNDAKRGTCPPGFIAFDEVDGMKLYFQDLGKTCGSCFIF